MLLYMKNSKSGFAPLVIILLLAVTLGGSAYVYKEYNKEQSVPSEVALETTTPASIQEEVAVSNTPKKVVRTASVSSCLPSGITLETVVSADMNGDKVTVNEALSAQGAYCGGTALLDSNNRPIRFYTLTGCWGNPPQNYGEVLAAQEKELAALQKTNTVITVTCNPSGIPIP